MFRLCIPLLLTGLVLFPAVLADEERNSTDGYIVREYALVSFSEEMTGNPGNATPAVKSIDSAGNETRRGGVMTARKLFELRQAAKEGFQKGTNQSGVSVNNSASCSGCIKTTGFGTF